MQRRRPPYSALWLFKAGMPIGTNVARGMHSQWTNVSSLHRRKKPLFFYEGEARAEKRPPPLSMCEETTEAQQSKTETHTKEEKTPLKVASMLVTRHRVLSGEKSRPTSLNPQKVPRASLG